MNLSWEELAAATVGAAAGLAYSSLFRCDTVCAVGSNPVLTALCGALIGFMMVGRR